MISEDIYTEISPGRNRRYCDSGRAAESIQVCQASQLFNTCLARALPAKGYYSWKTLYILNICFILKKNQITKYKLMVTKGERGGGGINQEYGINIYTQVYIKQINNNNSLYSLGNKIQYLVITYSGKELEDIDIDIQIQI